MDPIQFLEKHFGSHTNTQREALFFCPFCNHYKQKLSINLDTFFWKCWVCDAKGRTILGLVHKTGNRNIINDYKKHYPKHIIVNNESDDEDFKIELPEEYRPLIHNLDTFDGRRAYKYLKSRDVTDEQILQHKIGFATEGRFRNRLILPSFDVDGHLNFYTGRTFIENDYKYLNPSTPPGYKNSIVLNELNIDWKHPVYLVEGFMDMLQCSNAIPLFGSTLVEESKTFMDLAINEAKVYVCLDMDARKKQLAILKSLTEYDVECYDFKVNPYKDIGAMHRAKVLEHKGCALLMDRIHILRERIKNA